jgi:hypothetical protein
LLGQSAALALLGAAWLTQQSERSTDQTAIMYYSFLISE